MYHLRRILALISLVLVLLGMWNRHKEIRLLEAQYDLPVETILSQHRDENREGIRVNTTIQDSNLLSVTCKHKKLYGNSLTATVTAHEDTPMILSCELQKGEGKVVILKENNEILFQAELPFEEKNIPLTAGEYEIVTIGKNCTTNIFLSGNELEIEIV